MPPDEKLRRPFQRYALAQMRQPGFAPGFPDWRSDVLDETGRLSLYCHQPIYAV
ncbi:MAG TPA: hypothetical protein VKA91_00505 [Nitrososphaeraceae archaeon]|nr:hypothetical protein [Nitrososphaeraceae archaeon]